MDKWLKNNNVVKVLSLVLAIMLWMVVNINQNPNAVGGQQISTKIDQVQLQAIYDENKYFVTMPSTVQVEIKGSSDYFTLPSWVTGKNNYKVYVDLSSLKKGAYTVPVQFKGFPFGAEVVSEPKTVQVIIEEAKKVEKTVQVELIGKVKEGFVRGEVAVKPGTVMVSVPESKVQDLAAVQAIVNVEGATDNIDKTVELKAVDKNGQPIRAKINPKNVDVAIPVTLPYKSVPLELDYTGSPPDGIVISSIVMNPATITVYGPKDLLLDLSAYMGPTLDLSRFSADDTMKMKIPLYNQFSKTDPDTVEITVHVSTAVSNNAMDIPIKIVNLPQGRTATISKPGPTLHVQLQGTAENLAKLTKDDIEATIDGSKLGIGEQNVVIKVKAPYTMKVMNSQESLKAVVLIK
jgi:YbbR domain-containing protein